MAHNTSHPSIHCIYHEQSRAFCGPASLQIALSHFGVTISEKKLARLSGATRSNGTEHEGLIAAAHALGARVTVKEHASLKELDGFIHKKQLPVIVGWFDRDGDHYSVVVNTTQKDVIMMDPAFNKKIRTIPRSFFSNVWFDFVGAQNDKVSWRWYMVIEMPHSSSISSMT